MLAIAVRQRRDFGALLTLIGAHALLHRDSHDSDEADASSPRPRTMRRRESWSRMYLPKGSSRLCRRPCSELAAKLVLDKSVTGRRLRDATDRGYLVNLETRRGRPARIVRGDPMPEMVKLLPERGELGAWSKCCTIAALRRGCLGHPRRTRVFTPDSF